MAERIIPVTTTRDWVIVTDQMAPDGTAQRRYAYGPFETRREAVAMMGKADVFFSDLEVDLIVESPYPDAYAITYVLHAARLRNVDVLINDPEAFASYTEGAHH